MKTTRSEHIQSRERELLSLILDLINQNNHMLKDKGYYAEFRQIHALHDLNNPNYSSKATIMIYSNDDTKSNMIKEIASAYDIFLFQSGESASDEHVKVELVGFFEYFLSSLDKKHKKKHWFLKWFGL